MEKIKAIWIRVSDWWNSEKILPKIINWITRNTWATVIIVFSLYLIGFEREFVGVILKCIALGALGAVVANVALYIYTKFKFARIMSMGDDQRMNQAEQGSFSRVVANIALACILGVFLFAGISLYFQSDKVQGEDAKVEATKIYVDSFAIKKSLLEDIWKAKYEIMILDSLNKDTIKK
jgi:hypothetical protein